MAFTGFIEQLTRVSSGARIFSYFRLSSNGEGSELPALVLLHGHPWHSLMWKEFVEDIPRRYSVFVPDLPGYGRSIKAASPSGNSLAHSKPEWAVDIVEALDAVVGLVVGFAGDPVKIIPYGHDQGGRLACRLALDFPDRVSGAAMLDIAPTSSIWEHMKLENNMHCEPKYSSHGVFQGSPCPFLGTLTAADAEYFLGRNQYKDLENGKERVMGSCEDHCAGAAHDIEHGLQVGVNPASPSRVFNVPFLVLSSMRLYHQFAADESWESLALEGLVTSHQVGGEGIGRVLVKVEVGKRTREWLQTNWGV